MTILRDSGKLEIWQPSITTTVNGSREIPGDYDDADTLRLQLNVTAAAGTTPSLQVIVEDSLDGTNWNPIATFAAKTAAGVEVLNVTQPFTGQVRARWTIAGTAPSFTFELRSYVQ